MTRLFEMGELVVATHNDGKAREIADLLHPYVTTFHTAKSLGLADPEETGTTFIANAELKALTAARAAGMVALADDSGMAVDALDGDPGIYSARWAEREDGVRDFDFAMAKIEDALAQRAAQGDDRRSGAFICALSLAWPDGHVVSFEGRVTGDIVFPARGDNGFGYDPIFVPHGYDLSFAQMEADFKHKISHRADAFKQLVAGCFVDSETQ